jgi:hypothetical protein
MAGTLFFFYASTGMGNCSVTLLYSVHARGHAIDIPNILSPRMVWLVVLAVPCGEMLCCHFYKKNGNNMFQLNQLSKGSLAARLEGGFMSRSLLAYS